MHIVIEFDSEKNPPHINSNSGENIHTILSAIRIRIQKAYQTTNNITDCVNKTLQNSIHFNRKCEAIIVILYTCQKIMRRLDGYIYVVRFKCKPLWVFLGRSLRVKLMVEWTMLDRAGDQEDAHSFRSMTGVTFELSNDTNIYSPTTGGFECVTNFRRKVQTRTDV